VFPTALGTFVSKERIGKSFEQLARRLGEPLVDDVGRNRFGGHSARVSGACFLANTGLELYKLAVLARWASPVLLRYVEEAPLKSITDHGKPFLAGHNLHDVLQDVLSRQLGTAGSLPNLRCEIAELIAENATMIKVDEAIQPHRFLLNPFTLILHRANDFVLAATPKVISLCGWCCHRSRCKLFRVFPNSEVFAELCDKRSCFRSQQKYYSLFLRSRVVLKGSASRPSVAGVVTGCCGAAV
jgi:hypothetical protein